MIDEDEVGLKEKPEDTRYIKKINKTRSTGSADKGTLSQFAIIGTAGSGKCRCHAWQHLAGVWNIPASWRLQPGLKLWFPTRHKEEVFKVFEPKQVDRLLLPWYNFSIMVPRARQQGANCPLYPFIMF